MEKKYRIMLLAAAAMCIIIAAVAAGSHYARDAIFLIAEDKSDSYSIAYQSDSGSYFSATVSYTDESSVSVTSPAHPVEYTVDINSASAFELAALLPGIGEKKATAIVEYREITGGFHSVEELIEVSGITASLLERIRPYCTVSNNNQ